MKFREEITKIELEKLIHVTIITGFVLGVLDIIILRFALGFVVQNIITTIAVCITLGILFGFILAKVATNKIRKAQAITRPIFFDIQILENKIDYLTGREDYDLVGEESEE